MSVSRILLLGMVFLFAPLSGTWAQPASMLEIAVDRGGDLSLPHAKRADLAAKEGDDSPSVSLADPESEGETAAVDGTNAAADDASEVMENPVISEEVITITEDPDGVASLSLSLAEAINRALENNHGLLVRRLGVQATETGIARARSRFDPRISGSLSSSDRLGKQIMQTGVMGDSVVNRSDGSMAYDRTDPSGTAVRLELAGTRNRSARSANLFSTRLGLDLEHPLKRGAGRAINFIEVKQAELDVQASKYELLAFVHALTNNVEDKYWELVLALKELEIVRESLALAQLQMEETQKKIAIGRIPESELAAAEAETALREESVINAVSAVEKARIGLLRLINPRAERFWDVRLNLLDQPDWERNEAGSVEEHVATAVARRPEILQVEAQLAKDDLELVQTRNGLLPKLNFFVNLGKSGYAKTMGETATEFGARAYDLVGGIRYETSLDRREARADNARARFTKAQREEALLNLVQLIQEEVLTAFLELHRARQQIIATEKTVEKQKEKLRIEEVKFGLGKTTAFTVAQAQRDYSAAQIANLKAKVGLRQAVSNLYRFDGTLSDRWGIKTE
jgi:outer membrane protein TolC